MFSKISLFLQKYKQEILSFTGLLSIFALIAFVLWQGVNFISGLPGFRFDPFTILAIIVLGTLFSKSIDNQVKLLDKQNRLLENLIITQSKANKQATPKVKK